MLRFKKTKIFVSFIFCLFCFSIVYWFVSDQPYISTVGYIEGRQVEVCPENEGKISFSHVQEGDFVQRGQLLFQLDDRIGQSERKQAFVKLSKIKNEAESTKKVFEESMEEYLSKRRKKDMGLINQEELLKSLKELEGTKATFEEAKNALFLEEIKLECLDQKLAQKKITAPFEGIITKCYFSKGAFVEKNNPVLCLFDAKKIWAYGHLAEEDIHKVKIGSKAKLHLPAYPKASLVGEIEFISPNIKIIDHKKQIPIKIAITDSSISKDTFICNGMSADIKIQVEEPVE